MVSVMDPADPQMEQVLDWETPPLPDAPLWLDAAGAIPVSTEF